MDKFNKFTTESIGCFVCKRELSAQRGLLSPIAEQSGWAVMAMVGENAREELTFCPECAAKIRANGGKATVGGSLVGGNFPVMIEESEVLQ